MSKEIKRQMQLLDYMIVQYRIDLRNARCKAVELGFKPAKNAHIMAMREGLWRMQEEFDALRLQDTMTAFGGPT